MKYRGEVIKKTFGEIIESSGIGTWVWNIDTGETVFNNFWAEIIGYSLDELEPTMIDTWIKHAHPEDVLISQSQLKKVFNREIDFYVCECRMRHKDGYWVWVRDSGRVTDWDAEGNPLVMVGTHVDITMSKESELKLMESYSNLKDLQIKLDLEESELQVLDSTPGGNGLSEALLTEDRMMAALQKCEKTLSKYKGKAGSQKFEKYIMDLCRDEPAYSAKEVEDVVKWLYANWSR